MQISGFQNSQPVQNLPHADVVPAVGGGQDRLTGRPAGEVRGQLHHQEPHGEDPRVGAEICDGRPDLSGQRRGAYSLLLGDATQDGQPALR